MKDVVEEPEKTVAFLCFAPYHFCACLFPAMTLARCFSSHDKSVIVLRRSLEWTLLVWPLKSPQKICPIVKWDFPSITYLHLPNRFSIEKIKAEKVRNIKCSRSTKMHNQRHYVLCCFFSRHLRSYTLMIIFTYLKVTQHATSYLCQPKYVQTTTHVEKCRKMNHKLHGLPTTYLNGPISICV